jgi:TonB family protein
MGRIWRWLLFLLTLSHFLCAQEPLASTPSLRTDPQFSCSVEPLRTPLPELWSQYPGELRAELIIGRNGEVTEATALESAYSSNRTEAALKVLRTWEFVPATKNGNGVSLKMNATLRFSKTSATLEFEFLYPKGQRGCIHWP